MEPDDLNDDRYAAEEAQDELIAALEARIETLEAKVFDLENDDRVVVSDVRELADEQIEEALDNLEVRTELIQ